MKIVPVLACYVASQHCFWLFYVEIPQVTGAAALTTSGIPTGEDMEGYYKNQTRYEDPMSRAEDVD